MDDTIEISGLSALIQRRRGRIVHWVPPEQYGPHGAFRPPHLPELPTSLTLTLHYRGVTYTASIYTSADAARNLGLPENIVQMANDLTEESRWGVHISADEPPARGLSTATTSYATLEAAVVGASMMVFMSDNEPLRLDEEPKLDLGGWGISGVFHVVDSIAAFGEPDAVINEGAARLAEQSITDPVYYVAEEEGARMWSGPNSHGSVTCVPLVYSPGSGKHLYAIGRQRKSQGDQSA